MRILNWLRCGMTTRWRFWWTGVMCVHGDRGGDGSWRFGLRFIEGLWNEEPWRVLSQKWMLDV